MNDDNNGGGCGCLIIIIFIVAILTVNWFNGKLDQVIAAIGSSNSCQCIERGE